MRKEVYICDHCGKQMDTLDDYCDMDIDDFDFIISVDLCVECYEELSKMIKKFVKLEE